MGWCSGTQVFDAVASSLLEDEPIDKKAVLKYIIETLEYMDWDCQSESAYYEHPIVREILKELHPTWFEEWDEEED